jgi:pimeloyl-ACP methyl ester carboxylesterase
MISVLLENLAGGEGEGRRVLAPMMPGFAGSEGIGEIEDAEDIVFHLLDLLSVLGLEGDNRPHLVGLSLGAWMAAELACRYPERIRSLTLVNPAGLYVEGAPIGEIFGQPLDELAEKVFADTDHPAAQMMRQLGEVMRADPASVPFEVLRPFMEAQAATAKLAWNPYLHNPRLRRRLGRVAVPTLVVAAEADRLIPAVHAEIYAQEIPGAKLVHVAGGHMLDLESPIGLAEAILHHIEAVDAASSSISSRP